MAIIGGLIVILVFVLIMRGSSKNEREEWDQAIQEGYEAEEEGRDY